MSVRSALRPVGGMGARDAGGLSDVYSAEGAYWRAQARCKGLVHLFFPSRGESVSEAKEVCATCPVARECLEYALAHHERFGIWGGKTERERRRIRRIRRAAA
ncbi:MAG: WhiB family transcriptional regulator [Actinomycetota bacterium]|nr:WhiB family transcriptional regulator [Actinomycetota bacterium]